MRFSFYSRSLAECAKHQDFLMTTENSQLGERMEKQKGRGQENPGAEK